MLKKMLQLFSDLQKMDPALAQALSNIRAGRGSAQDANVLARGMYTDTMVPKMGNKMAYNDFLSRNGNTGYHVHADLNDFGQINKQHGEKMGDHAIKTFGNMASEVSRQFGGKSFRNGGDEFKFHFDRPEAAHGFARELRSRLEKQPKVGGTHNLAASLGIGFNPDHAEGALLDAKKQLGPTDVKTGKRQNLHVVGNAPTVIHSKSHEQPPEGWKAPKAKPQPKATPALAPEGLKFHNPLGKAETEAFDLPLDKLVVNRDSLLDAYSNTTHSSGTRGSHSTGPLSVWRTENGEHLLVDGHHRLAAHLLSTQHQGKVPVRVVGNGHSDYWHTPAPRERAKLDPKAKYGGLEDIASDETLELDAGAGAGIPLGKAEEGEVVRPIPPPNHATLSTNRPMQHPHAYEWHDGHTSHNENSLMKEEAAPGNPTKHPHIDGAMPKQQMHQNDQAAGKGVATYAEFAKPYGTVTPGHKSDLFHYDYRPHEHELNEEVKRHGFQVYMAGGKYGKPDLGKRNYNTGHLMIYDPTPASGGDFGDESYTRTWRTTHELAHALTYPQLNEKYGEGRRIGKLGVHRTAREAKRAVEWEWLAAHKQRELTEKLTGKPVPDELFHRELNTVMHDAVHRAVTGQFTEPSDEGFQPHSQKVPLETALGTVDAHARALGLPDDNSLIPKKR